MSDAGLSGSRQKGVKSKRDLLELMKVFYWLVLRQAYNTCKA